MVKALPVLLGFYNGLDVYLLVKCKWGDTEVLQSASPLLQTSSLHIAKSDLFCQRCCCNGNQRLSFLLPTDTKAIPN